MEKKINICDSCDKRISIGKCHICGMDLCENCAHALKIDHSESNVFFNFVMPNVSSGKIIFCKRCSAKIISRVKTNSVKMADDLVKFIVDKLVVESI